jgi:hypothetical protein
MQCPNCGETKVAWKKELWGAGKEHFWDDKTQVQFICGGRYIYDKSSDAYEQENPCRRKK